MAFGSGAMTNSIAEIEATKFILVIGSNTTEAHPVLALEIKKAVRQGSKLVVVDPRKIELATLANQHLHLQSGTNISLLNAMMYTIITEQLYDHEFVAARTENFEELKAAVANYSPEQVERYVGVPAEAIKSVAREYAQAESAVILYTMGITQHANGTNNVLSVANLALLCGHVGKPNSGVNPLRGQNNVQGACDMGALPNVYSGYQAIADPANNTKFSEAWGVELPNSLGLTVGEIMDGANRGSIKGLYIVGENPVRSDPDASHVEQALQKIDFLVVQDIFLTETAQLADVVLPGASFAEKDGTFSNTERRVQRVRKAIEPIGQSRPDWAIIQELSNRMDYPMNYAGPEQIFAEIASLTPSYAGMNYDRLEQGGLQWPCPAVEHPGTKYLHQGQFTRGLGKFHGVTDTPPAEQPDQQYPFTLNTGRRLTHYHTGTMTRRSRGLQEMMPEDYLELHPTDAAKLGVTTGDLVKMASRRGEVQIKAKLTEDVRPGSVFCSFHFTEVPVNYLTNPARDPIAKIPELKVCAVRIEKVK